jgi:glycosyltransferase involved in cell wall biosynthesis
MRPLLLGKGWFPDELGGLDRYFRGLYEALADAGVPARAVVVGPADEGPPGVTAASSHGAPLVRRLVAFHRAASGAAAAADVVDAHFALYAAGPVLFGSLRGLPLVVHFHGSWTEESVAAGDPGLLRAAIRRSLERAVYQRAATIVVLSQAFKQELVERYGIPPWTIRVIPPGVEVARFTPGDRDAARARFGVPSDAFLAVAVRRLVPRMGLDVLLDAVARLRDVGAAQPIVLVAGDGAGRSGLEGRARELRLDGAVRFLGRIPDDAVVDLYRAADLNVVPSRALEGFGLVVLEAAACGTPSLVTHVGGLPEAVAHIDRRLVVPPGDAAAMATAIENVMQRRLVLPSRTAVRAAVKEMGWERTAAATCRALQDARRGGRDDRLRVVYLDHVARLSGAELALLRLLPKLHGVDAHVILGEDGPLADRFRTGGVSVEVLPVPVAARDLRKDDVGLVRSTSVASVAALTYVVRLARRLRRLRPDLVHTNTLKAGVYGSVAAKLAGVPVVWHVRDRIDEDYLSRTGVRLVRMMTNRLPDGILVNSEATKLTLGEAANLCVLPSVIPEVMDAPAERTNPSRSPRTPLRIGMVGRLAPWKGQHIFLEAFARAFPDGEAEAVIIGSALFGEDDYAQELSRLADRLGIAGRVDMRGFRDDVWEELARLDILVHASVTPEPFGQVVVEGMAAGLPVITTTEGGPAEFVEHERTALQVPPKDEEALAGALSRLAADPALRSRLGTAARRKALEVRGDDVSEQVMEVYRRALWQGPRRPQAAGAVR